MKEKIITLLFSVALVFMPGCGCNDNNKGGSESIDTTPPTISSVYPEDEAIDVAVNISISATFSKDMDPTSINDTTFLINGATGAVTYDAPSKTALFTPSADLAYSTPYTATITTEAKDAAGNALESDYAWTFTSGVGPDATPPSVASTNPSDGETDVAVNTSISATFSEDIDPTSINNTTFLIFGVMGAITYDAPSKTATFQPSALLACNTPYTATITIVVKDMAGNPLTDNYEWNFTTGGSDAFPATKLNVETYAFVSDYSMAFNDSGDGFAFWESNNGNNNRIIYSTFNGSTGAWSTESEFIPNGNDPRIATNGTEFMIVYQRSSSIYAREYTESSWSDETDIDAGSNYAYSPEITSNGDGYCVTWRQHDSSFERIHANIYASSSWGGANVINGDVDSYSYNTNISSNGDGYCIIWRQHDGSHDSIYANIYSSGPLWEGASEIDAGVNNADDPQVASNGAGYCVTWEQDDGSYDSIYANIYSGAVWGGAATIDAGAANNAYSPQAASDGAGYCVTWYQHDGSYSIYANIYSGAAWGGAATIDAGPNNAYSPQAASNGSGYCVTWYQYDGSANSIYANIYSGAAWGGAATIDAGPNNAYSPQVASNGAGYCVTWEQDDGSNNSIYGNIYSASSWGSAALIETGTGDVSNKSITSSNAGYFTAWKQDDGSFDSLFANVYDGSWSGEANLVTKTWNGSCSTYPYPKAVTNDAGKSVVLWQQYNNGYNSVYANIYDSLNWGTTYLISENASSPDIAANGTDFMIVYETQSSVYAVTYDGTSWGTPEKIGTVTGNSYNPQVASNGAGYCAVWTQWDGFTYYDICAKIYSGTWGGAATIDAGANNADNPKIHSNGTGYCVLWRQSDGADRMYANIYSESAWGIAEAIDAGSYTYDSEISSNSAGYCVVFEHDDGTYDSIYANIYSSGPLWGGAAIIDAGANNAADPRVASNGSGYCVTWRQHDGSAYSIYSIIHNGLSWETDPTEIDVDAGTFNNYYANNPQISSNGDGYCVTWEQDDYSNYRRTHASIFDGSWGAASLLQTGAGVSHYPRIAANGAGYTVLWTMHDGLYNSIYGSSYSDDSWGSVFSLEDNDGDVNEYSLSIIKLNNTDYIGLWLQEDDVDEFVLNLWGAIINP